MLLSKETYNNYICQKKASTIYSCRCSKHVHRTKCQALTIARLTHSLYATKTARIRRYTMLKTARIRRYTTLKTARIRRYTTLACGGQ